MLKKIVTERMQLSPVSEEEVDELHQLWMQPEVRKYLWDDKIIPLEETRQIVSQSITAFLNNKYGLWVSRLIASEDIIGFCGYWPFFELPQVELIYGLSPKYWGRGLATEMARALLEYGFRECGLENIQASADVPNRASIAVMERLGMTFKEQTKINGKDLVFYQKQREELLNCTPEISTGSRQ